MNLCVFSSKLVRLLSQFVYRMFTNEHKKFRDWSFINWNAIFRWPKTFSTEVLNKNPPRLSWLQIPLEFLIQIANGGCKLKAKIHCHKKFRSLAFKTKYTILFLPNPSDRFFKWNTALSKDLNSATHFFIKYLANDFHSFPKSITVLITQENNELSIPMVPAPMTATSAFFQ